MWICAFVGLNGNQFNNTYAKGATKENTSIYDC